MQCPACHTGNPSGQKFCGSCGRKLESECPRCEASNPPEYKYCGQCGANLAVSVSIAMARSGLITRVAQEALDLLGHKNVDMQGKPFSLFVERDDLVVFFSHWNELIGRSKDQSFEIALKHKDGTSVYLQLGFEINNPSATDSEEITVYLNETSDSRLTSAQMQYQEDLVNLIFTETDAVNTVSKKHMDRSIEEVLKKMCLFAEADQCFIYSIDRRLKRLAPVYRWCKTSPQQEEPALPQSVPFAMIKRAVVRLRQGQAYVIDDVAKLSPAERYELLAWLQADLGAIVCHLIYSAKRPIGVIGMAKKASSRPWAPDCVALVKFFGQMLADKLPFATGESSSQVAPATAESSKTRSRTRTPKVIDIAGKTPKSRDASGQGAAKQARHRAASPPRRVMRDTTRPMLFEKLSGRKAAEQQPVFPGDDNLVRLTCPRCGIQESVSVDQFERLGSAISVTCPCRKVFTAVLEKRRAFRKPVQLDGHFTLKGDLGTVDGDGSIWGSMVVQDLSKAGLRFSTRKADLVHPGDLLMVRFNLDNSNQALIHKPARVISVSEDEVGCRFEGDDSYDITLGFYFI